MDLKSSIRTIVDYPKSGVRFRDITPLLQNPESFRFGIDRLYQRYQNTELDGLVALDARGFLFGSALAYLLGVPLIPVRKTGKLPAETVSTDYQLEYGLNSLEIHVDALDEATRMVIIDDLIATGGTMCAAVELISQLGGETIECAVIIELVDLDGRAKLSPVPLYSLVSFHEDEA